jgi:hypothetical protein
MSEPQTEECRLHAKAGSSWDPPGFAVPVRSPTSRKITSSLASTRRMARRITSVSYARDVHDDGETLLGEVAERLVKSDGPHGIMYFFRFDIG